MISTEGSSRGDFTFTTLLAGPDGIDLGQYKAGLVALENEWEPQDSEFNEEFIEDSAQHAWKAIILVSNEERVIAYGSMSTLRPEELELDAAFVSEPFRRQGIYKRLVEGRVEIARQMGFKKVAMSTAETNKATGWLSEFGFTTLDSTESWYDFEMTL